MQTEAGILVINFDPAIIETDPAIVLNFLLTQLGINLDEILNQLNKIPEMLADAQNKMIIKVREFLNLDKLLEPLDQMWASVSNVTDNFEKTVKSLTGMIATGVKATQAPLNATVYMPSAILAVLLCVGIVSLILYALEVNEYGLWQSPTSFTGESNVEEIIENISTLNFHIT